MTDVEIDKAELTAATADLGRACGAYRENASTIRPEDTGVGAPAGRLGLPLMLERLLEDVVVAVDRQAEAGDTLAEWLQSIVDEFEALDASLGAGWERGDDTRLA